MSVKCPACGFDSQDDAAWCDFCKEPFRKRQGPAPEPEPKPPFSDRVPVAAPEPAKRNGAPSIDEFKSLDPGERIPSIPPWVRWFAWAFLGLWFLWGMILLGFYLGKQRLAEEERGAPAPPAP